MSNNRKYLRDLNQKEIRNLQRNYELYLQRTRQGFLTSKEKRILLRLQKWQQGTTESTKSDFFYQIREKAKTAFGDYLLLTEVLTDDQLKEIFSKNRWDEKVKKYFEKKPDNEFWSHLPTIFNVLDSLFKLKSHNEPVVDSKGKLAGNISLPDDIDDSWKAEMAEDIVRICLKFFKEHRYISTKAHERLVEEVEDMLNVEVARGKYLKMSERVKGHA